MSKNTLLFCSGFLGGVLLTLLTLSVGGSQILPQGGMPMPAMQQKSVTAPSADTAANPGNSPVQGDPNAPVTLEEYADYHCPFCGRVETTIQQLVDAYPGKVKRIWKHYPLPFHQGSERTHQATECANDQGKFWEFHKALFAEPARVSDPQFVYEVAAKLGLNADVFKQCVDSGKYAEKVKNEIAEGGKKGVNGTPATFINGKLLSGAVPYEKFKQYVDHFLDPSNVALPEEAKTQPQENKPVFADFNDLDGKPTMGPKDAPITIVEFSDMHCPFCKKLIPTIDQLMKNYEGKIRLVFRNYPLPFHQGADKTHQAAMCAHDQGKFWEFESKVYENQDKLQEPDILKNIAKQAGVKEKKFKECIDKGKHMDEIQADIKKGADSGVRGTPSVFVNGELVVGARPYEYFDALIKGKLEKKG